jgi:hypothetical protein
MSLLPAPLDDDPRASTRQLAQARRAQARSELELFRYSLGARARAEIDRMDSQAAADALRVALDEELDTLEYGLARAGQSVVKTELVARKVEMLANTNNHRFMRRFGGAA